MISLRNVARSVMSGMPSTPRVEVIETSSPLVKRPAPSVLRRYVPSLPPPLSLLALPCHILSRSRPVAPAPPRPPSQRRWSRPPCVKVQHTSPGGSCSVHCRRTDALSDHDPHAISGRGVGQPPHLERVEVKREDIFAPPSAQPRHLAQRVLQGGKVTKHQAS